MYKVVNVLSRHEGKVYADGFATIRAAVNYRARNTLGSSGTVKVIASAARWSGGAWREGNAPAAVYDWYEAGKDTRPFRVARDARDAIVQIPVEPDGESPCPACGGVGFDDRVFRDCPACGGKGG